MPSAGSHTLSHSDPAAPPLPVVLRIPGFGPQPARFANNAGSAQTSFARKPSRVPLKPSISYRRRRPRWRSALTSAIAIGIFLGIAGYIWRIGTGAVEPGNRNHIQRSASKHGAAINPRSLETGKNAPEKSVTLVQTIIPVD